MDVNEVAQRLEVQPETVRTYIRQGLLRATPGPGHYVIEDGELERFLREVVPEVARRRAPDPQQLADDHLLTTGEVGALFGVGGQAVGLWIRQRRLRAIKRGKRWAVRYADVKGFRPSRMGRPFTGRASRAEVEEVEP